ncbi:MAG: transcription antitermination factor NusB [Weeksellaceae bacterium]|nr:transcription antitermination factor NusB [Weeksellaceae bacterium]
MLGRRQLRAKAMQSIYAYYRGNEEVALVKKNMLKGIEDVQDLYLLLLSLVLSFKSEADHRIQIGKSKNFPTEQELNPNMRFSENAIFRILAQNPQLSDFIEKNSQWSWENENIYTTKIFKEFTESQYYRDYMADVKHGFNRDREAIVHLFTEYIAPNEEILAYLEDKNLHWADDLHIANSMVLNTLKSFTAKSDERTKLYKLLSDDEHLDFTIDLYLKTIANDAETMRIIDEKASNWELERMALLDRIILQMAITEFLFFPSIPPKVTINEYLEIAKDYSTPNSNTFINGILDKVLHELEENGRLRKSARGMM